MTIGRPATHNLLVAVVNKTEKPYAPKKMVVKKTLFLLKTVAVRSGGQTGGDELLSAGLAMLTGCEETLALSRDT